MSTIENAKRNNPTASYYSLTQSKNKMLQSNESFNKKIFYNRKSNIRIDFDL